MCYSIEPRETRHVKGYGFLFFAGDIGTNAAKAAKNMSNKYSKKLVATAKKSPTDAIKTASKRAIQKTAEATGDLVGNKIADKITEKPSTAGPSRKDLSKNVQVHKKNHTMKKYNQMKLIMKYQKRDIFLQKKGKKLLKN